jgi:hypothetical protein
MKYFPRWFIVILSIMVAVVVSSGRPLQRGSGGDERRFPGIPFTVSGPFLEFYLTAKNPEIVFGFPISDVLDHPIKKNVKVQYFNYARMEYDPSRPVGKQVSLAALGNYAFNENTSGEDFNIATAGGRCRYFEESVYPVCYLFRQYYDAYQGESFIGLPVSNVRIVDGRLVQYFEFARMEWWPENEVGPHVVLTELGQMDYARNVSRADPESPAAEIVLPEVNLFPQRPLVGSSDTQRIFVVVQDREFKPIANATITYQVVREGNQLRDNQKVVVPMRKGPVSDPFGISTLSIAPISGTGPRDQFKVIVTVVVPDVGEVTAETTYRVWW